ncbi:hypothetical protein J1N35_008892 [Gossypium stocksii]|uniref:Uncharacterized protein n=1 Tax=Gossypium stocksii TaxID=47602 RepID=A0A9D4AGK2_9ROSI|nr:hypothetical protein J1N35_008892 [Gossypium stocksii]
MSHWSYYGNFGRQEYSYEHPYDSYECKVKYEVPKLKEEAHLTIVEHDIVGNHDEVMRSENVVFTLIDIRLRVGVRVELDIKDELNLKLIESVKEHTLFHYRCGEIDRLHPILAFSKQNDLKSMELHEELQPCGLKLPTKLYQFLSSSICNEWK